MKKIALLTVAICLFIAAIAQNADDVWTKDAKTQLANEAIAKLTAKYPDLTDDQKETVAICYTNAIINAHPKRSEWTNLMEIEVKKEKDNTLNQCVKSGGVQTTIKKEEPKAPVLNKALLVAVWKSGDEEYTFAESGTSLYQKGNNKKCSGTWTLDGKTITISPSGSKLGGFFEGCNKTMVFEVISFTDTELVVMDNADKKKIHFIKDK